MKPNSRLSGKGAEPRAMPKRSVCRSSEPACRNRLVKVADGRSELMRDVFGQDRLSARLVFEMERLLLSIPVELKAIFEVSE